MKIMYTLLLSLAILGGAQAQDNKILKAGMGKVRLEFTLDNEGRPIYSVEYGDKAIIKPSAMGFTLANDSAFDKHFVILGSRKQFNRRNLEAGLGRGEFDSRSL